MKPLQYEATVNCYNYAQAKFTFQADSRELARDHVAHIGKSGTNGFNWDKEPDEIWHVSYRQVGKVMWKRHFPGIREKRQREELHAKGVELHRRAMLYDELVEALRAFVSVIPEEDIWEDQQQARQITDATERAKAVLEKADNK